MIRRVGFASSALSILGLSAFAGPRIYGPRVYTSKDIGETNTKHLRSTSFAPITAEEALTKRECIRRRRQLAAIAARAA